MINWYYVQGSERVGPVSEEALRDLFQKETLTLESYIWRKGFANWERLKDISELDFKSAVAPEVAKVEKKERKEDRAAEVVKVEVVKEEAIKESSPEVVFNFDWSKVGNHEELFFIKIGLDRKKQPESQLYGPYSLEELKEALDEKRINNHTYIFAAGMPGWAEIGQTPLDPKNLRLNTTNVLDEVPLLFVMNNDPLPLVALVQEAGIKKCTLIGSGHFQKGKMVLGSIYSGSTLKAKNLKLTIDEYHPKEQKVICSINEIDETAKKIMQNYAN